MFRELRAFLNGQGTKPKPEIDPVLFSYEGCFLQKRAWRNFLFIGNRIIEVVHNKGNQAKERTKLEFSQIKEVYVADFDSGIPKDVIFLDHREKEIGRFNDANPADINSILHSIKSQLSNNEKNEIKVHRFNVYQNNHQNP